jgi:hypothetical protein
MTTVTADELRSWLEDDSNVPRALGGYLWESPEDSAADGMGNGAVLGELSTAERIALCEVYGDDELPDAWVVVEWNDAGFHAAYFFASRVDAIRCFRPIAESLDPEPW